MAGAPIATDGIQTKRRLAPTVLILLAWVSYIAYLTHSFAIKTFLSEMARLLDKFAW